MAPTEESHSALPPDVEAAVYDVWFDSVGTDRTTGVRELAGSHPEHARAIEALVADLGRGDGMLEPIEVGAVPITYDRVGPYVLGEPLGGGGFGTVYRAEQREPVHRTVAVKLLHATRMLPDAMRRFEFERHTLAQMQHPAIAQVLDAGEAPDGRPFFVMELVDGAPITEFCDRRSLAVDDRIRLVLRVCEGVAHAHQRGIVHRDLKPANVLVSEIGREPQPKIIDFGVAKLIEEGADPGLTLEGGLVGTPEYMSPEQASGGSVDTRTDVHALGVLLYELLTGDLPFERAQLSGLRVAEVVRIVAEDEPRRPSTAIAAATDKAAISQRRGVDSTELMRRLRSELDWILLRAIEKEPERRYPSVAALAADLERFLCDEPVRARPPTRTYLLRKFVRRHRIAVGIAAVSVLAVLIALGGVAWGLFESSLARERAEAASYAAHVAAGIAELQQGRIGAVRDHVNSAPEHLRGWEWDYLASRVDDALRVLPLGVEVRDFVVGGRDDEFLFVTSPHVSHVFALDSGEQLAQLEEGWNSASVSPDGFRVVVAANNRVRILRLPSLETVHELVNGELGKVRTVAWSPRGDAIAASGDGVHVLDIEGGPIRALTCEHGDALCTFDATGDRIASVGGDRIHVWDLATGERTDHSCPPVGRRVRFTPDGRGMICLGSAGEMSRISLDGNGPTWSVPLFNAQIVNAVFTSDGRFVAAAAGWSYPFVAFVDADTGALVARLNGHTSGVPGISRLADGSLLTAGRDGAARFWAGSPQPRPIRLPIGDGHGDVVFGPDETLITSSWHGTISAWDLRNRTLLAQRKQEGIAPMLVYDSRRQRVIASTGRPMLHIYSASSLEPLESPELDITTFEITTLESCSVVCVGSWNGELAILDADTWQELGRVQVGNGRVWVAADPNDRFVVAGVPAGRLVAVKADGSIAREIHAPKLHGLAVSPSGTEVVVTALDDDVRIYDLVSGAVRHEFPHPAIGAAWRPGDSRFAVGCGDHTVRLYDAARAQFLVALPTDLLACVPTFSPDGRRLAALTGTLHGPSKVIVWSVP